MQELLGGSPWGVKKKVTVLTPHLNVKSGELRLVAHVGHEN